jgi:hypothetical protein
MMRENWNKAGRRASLPIMGFLGRNGDGKDLAMVHDAMPDMMLGLPIVSTIPLYDWRKPCTVCDQSPCDRACGARKWPVYSQLVPLTSWDLLVDFREGLVLVSEIQGVASAKEHQGLPYQAANFLRKMRHHNVRFCWNAPDWMAADPVIRRVTKAVTHCKGARGVTHPLPCLDCGVPHDGPRKSCRSKGRARLWPDNRLFTWSTYDKADFEVWDVTRVNGQAQKSRRLKHLVRQRYWRPGGLVESVYNTYGDVLSLGTADMTGVCTTCGGTRQRRKCGCPGVEPEASPVSLPEWRRWSAAEGDREGDGVAAREPAESPVDQAVAP